MVFKNSVNNNQLLELQFKYKDKKNKPLSHA